MTVSRELAAEVVSRLNLLEHQTVEAARVLLEYLIVFDAKQHDYGPSNIARFGEQGILVRSSDKLERLINLADRGEDPSVSGEAVDDTWQDLMGYALIAQLVRRGMWLSGHGNVLAPQKRPDLVLEDEEDDRDWVNPDWVGNCLVKPIGPPLDVLSPNG